VKTNDARALPGKKARLKKNQCVVFIKNSGGNISQTTGGRDMGKRKRVRKQSCGKDRSPGRWKKRGKALLWATERLRESKERGGEKKTMEREMSAFSRRERDDV